jgi:Ca2+-transporting ATPase
MLNRDHDAIMLREVGGVRLNEFSLGFGFLFLFLVVYSYVSNRMPSQVSGLSDLLKSNIDRGINSNEDELLKRRGLFGENTYPRKKRKSIWVHSFPSVMTVTPN